MHKEKGKKRCKESRDEKVIEIEQRKSEKFEGNKEERSGRSAIKMEENKRKGNKDGRELRK